MEGLGRLYGAGAREAEKRYDKLAKRHSELFGARAGLTYISSPGRTEIAGNHTDHNCGRVLAAAVNLDTVVCAAPNDKNMVTVYSEGYDRPFVVDLSDLSVKSCEAGSSTALIRGVAARMRELGYAAGGFDAVMDSAVFKGSGLSSSAAFENAMCGAFDALYDGFTVEAKERARISQFAENVYFGKPCGLMDQTASSVGGLVAIDFAGGNADVKAMTFDFASAGYAPCVVAVGGEHGALTAHYAAIPAEMKQVARALGGEVLRDIAPEKFMSELPRLKNQVPDRALLRAMHFYDENERVRKLTDDLARGDVRAFLDGLTASGESSWKLLQNIYVPDSPNQEMALALELSHRLLGGKGAWRIHGGGFAGTILAFAPLDMLDEYVSALDSVFGKGSVTPLFIRAEGVTELSA